SSHSVTDSPSLCCTPDERVFFVFVDRDELGNIRQAHDLQHITLRFQHADLGLQQFEVLRYQHEQPKPCAVHETHLLQIHNEVSAARLFRLLNRRLKDGPIGIGQVSNQVQDYSLWHGTFTDLHGVILSYGYGQRVSLLRRAHSLVVWSISSFRSVG